MQPEPPKPQAKLLHRRQDMQKLAILPTFLTTLRIAVLPALFYAYSQGNMPLAVGLLVFSVATDLADGRLARKLGTTSKTGAILDVVADFTLILGMFLTFTAEGIYPVWFLGLVVFGFAQFVFSSVWTKKIYDPLGKYYGGVLFVAVFLTLAFPVQGVFWFVMVGFVVFSAISVSSRAVYLLHRRVSAS